jgi:hypothetical protein
MRSRPGPACPQGSPRTDSAGPPATTAPAPRRPCVPCRAPAAGQPRSRPDRPRPRWPRTPDATHRRPTAHRTWSTRAAPSPPRPRAMKGRRSARHSSRCPRWPWRRSSGWWSRPRRAGRAPAWPGCHPPAAAGSSRPTRPIPRRRKPGRECQSPCAPQATTSDVTSRETLYLVKTYRSGAPTHVGGAGCLSVGSPGWVAAPTPNTRRSTRGNAPQVRPSAVTARSKGQGGKGGGWDSPYRRGN